MSITLGMFAVLSIQKDITNGYNTGTAKPLEMGKWVVLQFSVYPIMFLIRYIECDEHANEKRKISNTYLVICINAYA